MSSSPGRPDRAGLGGYWDGARWVERITGSHILPRARIAQALSPAPVGALVGAPLARSGHVHARPDGVVRDPIELRLPHRRPVSPRRILGLPEDAANRVTVIHGPGDEITETLNVPATKGGRHAARVSRLFSLDQSRRMGWRGVLVCCVGSFWLGALVGAFGQPALKARPVPELPPIVATMPPGGRPVIHSTEQVILDPPSPGGSAPAVPVPAGSAPAHGSVIPHPISRTPDAVYYQDCDAVRAAGAAPLRRGQLGYRAPLDPSGTGVACP